MKFRKNWKRFWTLDRRHAEGFTLVELIVVIAILAILAGVGTVGYSGYVKKANMTADQTLVSEVANALVLAYYSDPTNATSDYVILTTTGASATEDGFAEAAMIDAFGENWEQTLSLSYGNWTDDGLLNYVLDNADSAELIASSTFLTTATPDGLMNAVTNLTDAATSVIQNYAQKGNDVVEKLKKLVGEEFVEKIPVGSDDPAYTTIISNMLVGHFAGVLNEADPDAVIQDTGMVGMMMSYATVYAYCQTIGDTTTMAGIDAYLSQSENMNDLSAAGFGEYMQQNCSQDFLDGYRKYNVGTESETGRGQTDISAALEIMGAVGVISGIYTDKDTLSNPDLYASESVSEQLNNYISAVKSVAKLHNDVNAMTALESAAKNNSVVIFVAEDGSVSVIPGAAYLAS